MARLRKAAPVDPSAVLYRPGQVQQRRSSPRKAVREISYIDLSDEDEENSPLKPKPLRREISALSILQEDSFYTARSHASPGALQATPRKQRTLRPVESNSRLLRKLSDESLASPEKKCGSGRRTMQERDRKHEASMEIGRKQKLMYAKSLARSVAARDLRKINLKIDVLDDVEPASARQGIVETPTAVQEDDTESDEETSILCGDEADVAQEIGEHQVEIDHAERATHQEHRGEDDDEEDEEDDIVLPVRSRHRQPRRPIDFDSESESESEEQQRESDQKKKPQVPVSIPPPRRKNYSATPNCAQEIVDLTDSQQAIDSFVISEPTRARSSSFAISRPATSSSNDDAQPILTYSPTPTKKRSPRKAPPMPRPETPPLRLPSSNKLVSPSKNKPRIPQAPDLRPSLDAFWNPEVVNNWNTRHSPAKTLVSPKKQQWRDDVSRMMGGMDLEDTSSDNEANTSPIASPNAKLARPWSVVKETAAISNATVKQIRAQKRDFAEQKHDIATSFLAELDNTICSGAISKLSKATGGIKLIWSNTLKTTAGRANWRREIIRIKTSLSPPTHVSETRHHCSIELASKVIDDSPRLYNVLAHEFCHLLTFMISEVRNNPHGAEFKAWGRKVSAAFPEKGVEVTTKHSYAIEYKFVWECVDCGYEFKRHSRSVDTKRHSCGKCKGTLVQTKPTPRNGGVGMKGDSAKMSEYQAFVKQHFKTVKEDMAVRGLETSLGKVMETVAKLYRQKQDTERQKNQDLSSLDQALNKLSL
ncbi:hypothetical protein OPT61_g3695 [Boeremia exigua]|uniref:Uncharacterized protein n=1 Tax=Boeremia exigua TaxID=749465 RepID=A0ACC2IGY6_9PLEO|nr:hypothetical protein OPT61_g3695 [Boeremia exigua]